MPTALLDLQGIDKRFGITRALDGASLTVRSGSVHALLGENGAGKTTLMRVAYGLIRADAGIMQVNGSVVHFSSAADAMKAGIGMVHQHFTLVPAMTVAENVALGLRGRYDVRATSALVREVSTRSRLPLDPSALVARLGIAAQQRLEIVKALAAQARLLILDEPTAVLAPVEALELGRWVRAFADSGGTVVMITHKLREALSLADEITVLRQGRTALTGSVNGLSTDDVIAAMLGTRADPVRRISPSIDRATPVASVSRISLGAAAGAPELRDVTCVVFAGEIVGVAGLESSGHNEFLRVLSGRLVPARGDVRLPRRIGFIPEDRHRDALALSLSVRENVALRDAGSRRGRMPWEHIEHATRELISSYEIHGAAPDVRAAALSGGNQQKLVVARELADDPELVVAENPARGLDVGATEAVHGALRSAADRGAGVVVYASDIDELLALADRIVVACNGSIRPVPHDREAVGRAMIGEA